jgi:hypothetical protein
MIREGTVKKKPTYMQLLCILLKTKVHNISNLDVLDCDFNDECNVVCLHWYTVLDDKLFH